MDQLQIILLAIVQGLTEFLPISSSGHLLLPKELLGWPDQGLAFDVAVHVGSLAAVLLYFRKDVINLLQAWLGNVAGKAASDDSRLAWCVIIATLPAGLIGLLADSFIEQHLRGIAVVASTTILFGLLLGWADKTGSQSKTLLSISWRLALIIGFAQALALIPGTSRSGITITAALLLGFSRESSARFSFLLSIPLIVAAGGLKTLQLASAPSAVPWGELITGAVISGITAYLCIYYFLKLIDRIGMMPFVYYRLVLGVGLLAILWL
ncbi:undecaprenyl-diphosphate phosphatase [Dasania sp. GY-MA-18]|uniref:Undecaprenyl-diphosphatase n=1 Tax=Dasania phycosphaerae TaxID=2950436 RepID=A0A9J6RN27_9GAMM|nr:MULTISPECIES: undecaprenyl-diphosphate phosphatase [Dasania]MCR8923322.1 undecaprenyl-diphosphate phosphatase [Dasania sp. GY-MA-18]MCZ0865754.1 undecaprenyl-diphosphate phosphatase [Dasania phycosphaerae]MCZ0869479.1 undecaprenyl-diphosphate phosphatase [Dasania phycosphaerae]